MHLWFGTTEGSKGAWSFYHWGAARLTGSFFAVDCVSWSTMPPMSRFIVKSPTTGTLQGNGHRLSWFPPWWGPRSPSSSPLAAALQVLRAHSLGSSRDDKYAHTQPYALPRALTPRPLWRYSLCCVRKFELVAPLVGMGLASIHLPFPFSVQV